LAIPSPAAAGDSSPESIGVAEDKPDQGPPVYYSYHNYSQIRDHVYAIQAQHSDIAIVYDIGDSWEKKQGKSNRDILAVKISDNVSSDEDEPEVLVVALNHAREWTTSEIALELVDNLTDEYQNDSRLSWLVDNREIWIVPVVNPDGLDYSLTTDEWWRKNRRLNYDGSYGVDLNRNYNGSMNGDPDGEWGGAGSSHNPPDEIYCGMYAFSEPETQAVRDLIMAHDFEIALDFHSYSNWVMWPWGYTYELPPDNADLVRIGTEFANLNGYYPAQSSELYFTTGDSIDWMYGGEDVYAFCFEVGNEFHPALDETVWGIILENLPPSFYGIEIAGDREEKAFDIVHTPSPTRYYSETGYEISADITAERGVNVSDLALYSRLNGAAWIKSPLTLSSGNDTYGITLPPCPVGSLVEYYFVAHDMGDVELMSPTYAPYEVHSFNVIENPEAPVADAGDDVQVEVGSNVTFNGTGSSDDKGIVSYVWSFVDDGSQTLFGPTPYYVFENAETFAVTLNVTDDDGLYSTDVVLVTVVDDQPPTADAGLDQTALLGQEVYFDGSGSIDNDGVANYTWTFLFEGDEVPLYGISPAFTFSAAGTYVVTLNVTDPSGNSATDTMTVEVLDTPIPEFSDVIAPTLALVAMVILLRRSARERARGGN
jgi:PKD repeat protein